MTRFAAALILALTVNPLALQAQETKFTITAPSAEVYKGPSNATPIIGHVPRGRVMTVSRNLGSWIKVAWPAGPNGVGYIHVTMGQFGLLTSAAPQTASAAPRTTPASTRAATSAPPVTRMPPLDGPSAPPPPAPQHTTTVGHVVGIGGTFGSMSTFGASARVWQHKRFGIQLGYGRDAITSDVSAGRVTSLNFEPGVLYALFDRVTDYVWIRPYAGSVMTIRQQTMKLNPTDTVGLSDTGVGFRALGGCEVMSAGLPHLAVSAEVTWRKFPTPFPGFEAKPFGFAVAAHWYVK